LQLLKRLKNREEHISGRVTKAAVAWYVKVRDGLHEQQPRQRNCCSTADIQYKVRQQLGSSALKMLMGVQPGRQRAKTTVSPAPVPHPSYSSSTGGAGQGLKRTQPRLNNAQTVKPFLSSVVTKRSVILSLLHQTQNAVQLHLS
jgi:hypothetical protein